MANQIEAIITRIGSSSQSEGTVISFPVHKIMILEYEDGSFINYNDTRYFSSQTVSELVDGSPLLQATIVQINTSTQQSPLQIAFHSELVEISPSSGVADANSVIKLNGINYYATETMSDLVATANEAPTEVTVYQLKTVLTDAQIKALPTNFIELVEAPGEGKVLLLHSVIVTSNILPESYGNENESLMSVVYGEWDEDATLTIPTTNLLTATPNSFFWFIKPIVTEPIPATPNSTSDYANKPLKFVCDNNGSGNFTGGDSGSTLSVTVFYSIVDL